MAFGGRRLGSFLRQRSERRSPAKRAVLKPMVAAAWTSLRASLPM